MKGLRMLCGMLGASLSMGQVTIHDLGDLGGAIKTTVPDGLSGSGQVVVGRSMGPDGWQAFRWDLATRTMTGLEHGLGPDATRTRAYDVNADGSIIVGECLLANGSTQGMIWDAAGSHLVSSEFGAAIHGISDDGRAMALAYTFTDGSQKKVGAHLWNDYGTPVSELITLPLWEPPIPYPPTFLTGSVSSDISANGLVVVGESRTSMANNAVRWVFQSPDGSPQSPPIWMAHTFEDYPDSESSYANGVNGDGTIVVGLTSANVSGDENNPDWRWRGFKWSVAGGMEILPALPGHNVTEAHAISGDGSIIAGTSGIDSFSDAVYWVDGQVHRLADEIEIPADWKLVGANGVNDLGTCISGYGTNDSGTFGWLVTGLFRDGLQDAEDIGDGWAESSWYGFFWRAGKSHVWHFAHGWQYVPKGNRDSVMVYDYGIREWVWNSEQTYPFLYMYGTEASWMGYYQGTEPGERWFFHYGKDKWVAEADLSGG